MTSNAAPGAAQERHFGLRARVLLWALPALAVADWAALKSGWLQHPPVWLGVLATPAILLLLTRFVFALTRSVTLARGRLAAASEALFLAGLLICLVAVSLDWLFGVQGRVVLHEGEGVPLGGRGPHIQELTSGPLAGVAEMEIALALVKLELLPTPDGGSSPRSRLLAQSQGKPQRTLEIDSLTTGAVGPLRLAQGAFGLAPRIVIVHGDETVFDRTVPFTTELPGRTGISFAGVFTVEKESLEVRGAVRQASLEEGMHGPASLELEVLHDGIVLGRAQLLPGHSAELADGWRVGFEGLAKWSEIEVARETDAVLLVVGAALAVLGGLAWLLARWIPARSRSS